MSKRNNYRSIFIEKANTKHNHKYDYSLVCDDINSRTIVEIICPEHGKFTQEARVHISNGSGCQLCSHESTSKKLSKNNEHFITKIKRDT